jgi:hypothetical protein
MVILCCLRHTVFLLVLLPLACGTLKVVAPDATTVTGSGTRVFSTLTLWSMAEAGREVVKVL